MFRDVQTRVPGMDKVTLSTHTHDDLGMAVATRWREFAEARAQVECTINGIGERAATRHWRSGHDYFTCGATRCPSIRRFHSEELYAFQPMLTRLTGMPLQRNKAIVAAMPSRTKRASTGRRAQERHHLRNHHAADGGHAVKFHRAGKHSGRHALVKRYEDLGYQLTNRT